MDTASYSFVAFGLAVALLSNLNASRLWRSSILLLASFVFIAMLADGPMVLLPLAGFLLLGYLGIQLVGRWPASRGCSILVVIAIYIWLKKYTFLPENMLLHLPYLALGLSYIFFRVVHLLIEAGNSSENLSVGPLSYLLYTLNFTTFISGPIQRYDEFARDQFAETPVRLGMDDIGLQFGRIVKGFFKVNVLAIIFNMVRVDAIAEMFQPVPISAKLFAAFRMAVMYPLFLYANFSGYIDIVIAIARLMRLRLPENFERPFSASSVLDFWNRWHITLSNWLKTYVYNPLLLTLMRRISAPAAQQFLGVFCFFVTFFLVGVWHGRTSEFIFFGILTGAGMAINKLWQLGLGVMLGRKGYKSLARNPLYISLGRGLTFVWYAFTLFWFGTTWREIDRVFAALTLEQWIALGVATWIIATLVLAAWEWLRSLLLAIKAFGEPVVLSRYARVVYASALALAAFVMTVLLNQPAPGIVYKAF